MAVSRQGRYAEAETLIRESYETDRRVLGENHSDMLDTLGGLANSVAMQGRLGEAEALYRKAYEGSRATLGDNEPDTVFTASNLSLTIASAGRCKEAESLLAPLVASLRTSTWKDDPITVMPLSALGYAFACQGRAIESDPLFAESIERSKRLNGRKSRYTARVLYRAAPGDAILGSRDPALAKLNEAAATGLTEPGALAEKDFAALRDDPRFREAATGIDNPPGGASKK
jgi:hypothetical protein